jgi:putative transposase
VTSKYGFIDAEKASYPVTRTCAWTGVARSGFYDRASRPQSATHARREELKLLTTHVFTDSDGTYGYRRVHAALTRTGVEVGPEPVRDLTRVLDLTPCQPRPWRPTTTVAGDAAGLPDLVERDFSAAEPGRELVGDITYVRTWEGWLYLATVIDCCTKERIGYAMADHLRTELVIEALDVAATKYPFADDVIFRSDRGVQHTSQDFADHADQLGIRRSVGRTGVCYDNAQAETFNSAVKNERVNRTEYPTREHARKDVTRYIEIRYNTLRLHSALRYRTPREAHNDHIDLRAAA